MSSVENVLRQLQCRFIIETMMPYQYLNIPEVYKAVIQNNWCLHTSDVKGWIMLLRVKNYYK